VTQHNEELPHSAFRGQTPDEMYFDKGKDVSDQLETRRAEARSRRLAENRRRSCGVCEEESLAIAGLKPPLHLHHRVSLVTEGQTSSRPGGGLCGRVPGEIIVPGVARTRHEFDVRR